MTLSQIHSIVHQHAHFLTGIQDLLWDKVMYLDPGSGSYLLQLLIAGFLGAALIIRMSWGKIVHFFKSVFSKDAEHSSDE